MKIQVTRMHSSRMRTVRSSGRISGRVPGPGGVYLVPGGVYLVQEGTWSWGGVPGPGGYTWSWGVYLVLGGCIWSQGGVPGPGGVYLVPGSVSVPGGRALPPPCGQTDACKNITFATSLRMVTRMHSSRMLTTHSLTASHSIRGGGGGGGMHGRGACVVGGMNDRGGGMYGRGCAWRGAWHARPPPCGQNS